MFGYLNAGGCNDHGCGRGDIEGVCSVSPGPYNFQRFHPGFHARGLLTHSRQVMDCALQAARKHPELGADLQVLADGAMLHDVGIYLCHAPSIYCHGDAPYLMHGYLGGQLLRELGLPVLARICERHTGAGLTRETIIAHQLDMPLQDYLPETLEEKIICWADKFYSKSHPDRVRTPQQAYQSLLKFGEEGAKRFLDWQHLFG